MKYRGYSTGFFFCFHYYSLMFAMNELFNRKRIAEEMHFRKNTFSRKRFSFGSISCKHKKKIVFIQLPAKC